MLRGFDISRTAMRTAVLLPALFAIGLYPAAQAQTPAPAAAPAASQRGTVKAVSGNAITVATDAGQQVTVTLGDTAKVVQLPPGSTDLKAATPATATDIAVGDRILATGKPGDTADKFTAARVILMKSSDIAQKHAQEQADWQKRGSGGLVTAADPAAGTFTIAVGAKKVEVKTTPTTIYRRYSGGSIKFEDAVPSTVADLHVGDQLRVRGAKSDDGSSIQAEEIVSGSFANLSGTIATINPTDNSITLKDLTTKKMMTVKITPALSCTICRSAPRRCLPREPRAALPELPAVEQVQRAEQARLQPVAKVHRADKVAPVVMAAVAAVQAPISRRWSAVCRLSPSLT